MFKENRFIFEHAEFISSGYEGRRFNFGKKKRYEGGELPREIKEKEKQEKEDNIRVAEKLMNNLEMTGIKCPRCGLKNVSEIGIVPPNRRMLYCLDCRWKWEVE